MVSMRYSRVDSRPANPFLASLIIATVVSFSFVATETACAGATQDSAQASAAVTESTDASTAEMIATLIEELGANKFAIRERATQQLTAMGPEILTPLTSALADSDPEIRMRAKRILIRVKQVARLDRLQSFVTHSESARTSVPTKSPALPGWKALREAVGDSPETRNLLAAVLRENWDLIELHRDLLNVESVTAALLLAQDPRSNIPDTEKANLLGLLHQLSSNSSARANAVGDPWKHKPFRGLVSRMLVRCTEPTAAWQTFSLALRHNLEAAVAPALTVIEDRESRPHIRQYALLTIAKFGSEENVDKIKQLLNDEDVCYRREDPRTKEAQFECQVRDVAFATMIHLTSRDPRQFGFVNAKANSYSVYQPSTLGFANDDERKVAYAKWESESGESLSEVGETVNEDTDE